MSQAQGSKSSDPTAAKSEPSKGDQLVVLLEGIHASAVEALRHDGYTRIVTHAKSLAGMELRAAPHALLLLLTVTVLAAATPTYAAEGLVPVPPLQARLTDLTGTLTTEQQTGLEQSLRAFESRKGTQIAVLIVPTTKPEEIEQYTLRVVKQWKLGRKKVDDGALLLIAKDDRSLRVEVGYGIEGALHAPAQVKRAFPHAALNAIEQALKASETTHTGEVHFVVEGALDGAPLLRGQTAKERALALFSELRMWDTEHNTGVLIYLLLADGAVEIVADRGIHAKAGPRTWVVICHEMEAAFKAAKFENGAVSGIQAVTRQMVDHFPADAHNANELPDKPLVI